MRRSARAAQVLILIGAIGGCGVAIPTHTPSVAESTAAEPSPTRPPDATAIGLTPSPQQPPASATSVATPSARIAEGVQGFVAELQGAGATVLTIARESRVPPPALFTDLAVLCVNSERVSVYRFPDEEERARVTAQIDRDDPSDVGDAYITWAGHPWFWERDRIVVVYVGGRSETQELLTSILGEPFARTSGAPPPADPCS